MLYISSKEVGVSIVLHCKDNQNNNKGYATSKFINHGSANSTMQIQYFPSKRKCRGSSFPFIMG